jgi:hypothetical protein
MRGCEQSEVRVEREEAQEAMGGKWSEVYEVNIDPALLSPRCGNWQCERADHWSRKRRKQDDRPSDKEHKKMMLLVATGTSQATVAHIFGVTQQAVSRYWQSFVPRYRHHDATGGDRKGTRFSKRIETARRRVIEKIYTKEKKA